MTRRVLALTTVFFLMCCSLLMAQQGTIGQLYRIEAAPGHAADMEAGAKAHMAFHKSKGDSWEWHFWSILAGPYTGQYWAFTPNHKWSDFDSDPIDDAEDGAHNRMTMGPHVGNEVLEYLKFLPEQSIVDSSSQFNLITVWTVRLVQGKTQSYLAALKTLTDTLRSADKGFQHSTYRMIAGAAAPTIYLSFSRSDWGDFESRQSEFMQIMLAAHGEEGTARILEALSSAVRRTDIHIAQFMPELSLVAAQSQ